MRTVTTIFALLLAVPAWAQQPAAPPEPVVVTTGEGVVQVVPDRAFITIGAESRANTAREAQRLNAAAMTPVQDKLKAAGVPAEAIRTIGYDVQYEWDVVNGKRVGRGYVARNTIELRVDAIDRVGEFMEMAVGSGATSIGGVRFDLKERDRHEREALRMAVADARAKAESAATGAGRTIDRILRIQEEGASLPVPMAATAFLRAEAKEAAPPISSGQIELRARVTVTASLK